MPPAHASYVERDVRVDGRRERAYFDLSPVDRQANEIEFFLILGMLFSMILFMYIMAYHQLDVTQQQLRALLSLALPRQVAERFLVDPTAYDKKAGCRPRSSSWTSRVSPRRASGWPTPRPALGAHGEGDGPARRRAEQAGHDHGQVHRRRGHELPGRPARRGRHRPSMRIAPSRASLDSIRALTALERPLLLAA